MPAPARSLLATLRRWLYAHPLQSLHARHKFALLAVLGVAMVVTPLVDVVRRQAADLQTLLGARAGLEPMARALDVQRALIVHRAAAALVLGGHVDAEPQRRARETEVDSRLAALTDTLARGRYALALEEDAALRADWTALVERIVARRTDARGSDASHRLLIEQVLQVMDLVGDVGGAVPGSLATADLREPRLAARLALAFVRMESLRRGGSEREASQARKRLHTAAREAAAVAALPGAAALEAELVQARALARDAMHGYLAALDADDNAGIERAAATLADALAAWSSRAVAAADTALVRAHDRVARERMLRLGLLALLALVQCVLMVSVRLQFGASARHAKSRLERPHDSDCSGGESRQQAQHLMLRLRDPTRDPREEAPPSQL